MFCTEYLKVEWNGESIKAPNRSGIFWGVFDKWWDIFAMHGDVAMVGDEYPLGIELKSYLAERFPMIENIYLASLENADYDWDITKPRFQECFHWIVCQAVLEHVKDPVAAVKSLSYALKWNGFVMLHSHGPRFKEHRHPIDCYRFLRDGVIALAELAQLQIVDMLWTESHWFLLGKKG